MAANKYSGAAAPGQVTSGSEAAHVTSAGRIEEQESRQSDFRASGMADQAALTIEGAAYATAFIARMHDGTTQPGELAVIVEFLRGEMLHGACRVIEKALGASHA